MNSSKNSQAENPAKNSRPALAAKNSRPALGQKSGSPTDPQPAPATESPEILRARLKALKRQQAKGVVRGVALVLALPLSLCALFAILKACGVLLLSWGWCFAPLALLAFPAASFVRAYVLTVKAYKAATTTTTTATTAAREAKRGKAAKRR